MTKKEFNSIPAEVNAQETNPRKASLLKNALCFLGEMLVFLLVFSIVFTIHIIPSDSMEPTVKSPSIVLCLRLPYALGEPVPNRGDIVAYKDYEARVFKFKRIIGLPGDDIFFDGGYVYLNGEKLSEPYLMAQGNTHSDIASFTVPEGAFFAMGDNREVSIDSRNSDTPYIAISAIYSKMLFAIHI